MRHMAHSLEVVFVTVQVKPEFIAAFVQATSANAEGSRQEPGVARFDIVQDQQDPAAFVLIEIYRSKQAPLDHKETAHYKLWRDTVAPMMAQPRHARKFRNVSPEDAGF